MKNTWIQMVEAVGKPKHFFAQTEEVEATGETILVVESEVPQIKQVENVTFVPEEIWKNKALYRK